MQNSKEVIIIIKVKYDAIIDCLTEKGKRLWAASEALSCGYGGVSLVAAATKLSRTTIHQGIKEIQNPPKYTKGRNRKKGGGRKSVKEHQPDLLQTLDNLVEPTAKGDPMRPLRWVRNCQKIT